MNLNQLIDSAGSSARIGVTIVTNQDNGIASYAVGTLHYSAATFAGGDFHPARLATSQEDPLDMYFSDRVHAHPVTQPLPQRFSAQAKENLAVWISLTGNQPRMAVQVIGWGGASVFYTEESGNLLVGLGPSLGTSPNAVWVFAFTGLLEGPPG